MGSKNACIEYNVIKAFIFGGQNMNFPENSREESQFYSFKTPRELLMLCRRLQEDDRADNCRFLCVGDSFFMVYSGIAPIWVCDFCVRIRELDGMRVLEHGSELALTASQLAEAALRYKAAL